MFLWKLILFVVGSVFFFLFKRNLNDVSLLDEINSVRKEIVNSL